MGIFSSGFSLSFRDMTKEEYQRQLPYLHAATLGLGCAVAGTQVLLPKLVKACMPNMYEMGLSKLECLEWISAVGVLVITHDVIVMTGNAQILFNRLEEMPASEVSVQERVEIISQRTLLGPLWRLIR